MFTDSGLDPHVGCVTLNPGLKSKKDDLFADGYEIARKTAKAETGLPRSSFPTTPPPFTLDEAEDETFVPKPAA